MEKRRKQMMIANICRGKEGEKKRKKKVRKEVLLAEM